MCTGLLTILNMSNSSFLYDVINYLIIYRNRDGSNDKNFGTGQGKSQTKPRDKGELRPVLDRLSKKDIAKWEVPLGRKCKLAKMVKKLISLGLQFTQSFVTL